jgi:hypothetical protein
MAIISIPSNLSVNPGASITIPVNINDATGVESVDLTISYNTALVDLTAVSNGTLTGAFTVTPNINDPIGTVTISLFGTAPIANGSGSIVQLTFSAPNGIPNGSSTVLDLVSASINEGAIAVSLTDGSLTIGTISQPSLAIAPATIIQNEGNAGSLVAGLIQPMGLILLVALSPLAR